jgi:hypothetical protein
MAPVDAMWRDGMIAQLLSLHDAARLIGPRYLPTDATEQQKAQMIRPGVELYQALFEPKRVVPWRCPIAAHSAASGTGRSPRLLEVRNRRLAIIRTGRPPALPSGWRPEEWLIIDLQLLALEHHKGTSMRCPHCDTTHLFERRRLAKRSGNPHPEPGEPGPSEPPSEYPSIHHAAFARIHGPLHDLEPHTSEQPPEIYVSLTDHRRNLLDQHTRTHPEMALTYQLLLSGPYVRMPDTTGNHRTQPGIYPNDPQRHVWEWPPPDQPDHPDQ